MVQIARLGEKKREENFRFRVFVKRRQVVERQLRNIAAEVQEQIDCTSCAQCCRVATTTLKPRDVDKLLRFLGMRREEFLARYTESTEEEGLILRRTEVGCVFLDGNLCTVYEARPDTCEGFPHLIKSEHSLVSRMWQFVDRACYCPIVYNTLEAWKVHLRFRG